MGHQLYVPRSTTQCWGTTLIRRDWCISAWLSTVLVGATYLVVSLTARSDAVGLGAVATGVAYALSHFTFIIRAFCRLPRNSSLASRPIFNGAWAAFVGGLVYGGCIAIGVTLAYFYVTKGTWNLSLVTNCLIAQFVTVLACGFMAVPGGMIAGVIYSFHRWMRAEAGEEPKSRS